MAGNHAHLFKDGCRKCGSARMKRKTDRGDVPETVKYICSDCGTLNFAIQEKQAAAVVPVVPITQGKKRYECD